ncbi:MAG: hypothetical protein IKC93_01900, partial [Candidatus Methanomethylophilaceae archaeon]|nr:hypothetical protein [Candidatus Methanomethylophilaceae archaeon]
MEVKRMSKTRELFAVIMAFAMVFAGIAIIATEADAVDASELNLQGSVSYYQDAGKGTLTNESLGDYSIEKVTTGDSVVYNVTGYAFAQPVAGEIDTVFESWWTTNANHVYGIILDDGNGNQFLLYMNDGKLKQTGKTITFGDKSYVLNIDLKAAVYVNNGSITSDTFAVGGMFILNFDETETTISEKLTISKETIIIGNGKTIKIDGWNSWINVNADTKISDLNIVGTGSERGLNIYGDGTDVVLDNVDITVSHYALNIPSGGPNVTLTVTDSTIQGYCAFQTHSNNTTATFTDCTLTGYNQWTDAGGWNDFATIVVNKNVTGADFTFSNCSINEDTSKTDEDTRAHELAVLVGTKATGTISFTDGTTIAPLEGDGVITTIDGFNIIDDGTTDVVGMESFADAVIYRDTPVGEEKVAVGTDKGDIYYSNAQAALDDIIDLLQQYDDITIEAEETLEIRHNILIGDNKTLTIIGATIIVPVPTTAGYVYEKYIHVDADGSLVLESADIRVPVIVEEGAYVSITKAKEMTVDGDATADLGVGYGNTLILSNLTVPAGKYIEAYGNVVIGGNVTIQKGAQFRVHPGGNAQIDGALTIEGTAEIRGDTIVNGSVKVYNADGGAIFQTDNTTFRIDASSDLLFEPTITVSGTMDVLKSKSKEATVDNRLIANADLVVEGTLAVTGTFNGDIRDRGTVVFNGTAGNNATITIYDGVSITIASVTGGVLTIKDDIDVSEFTSEQLQSNRFSDENTVVLDEVKGIIVSTELSDTVKTMGNGDKIRYHIMT